MYFKFILFGCNRGTSVSVLKSRLGYFPFYSNFKKDTCIPQKNSTVYPRQPSLQCFSLHTAGDGSCLARWTKEEGLYLQTFDRSEFKKFLEFTSPSLYAFQYLIYFITSFICENYCTD